MNTTHNTTTKRLRLAAVAVATPALLIASAGTAQAWPIPEPWPNTDDVSTPSDIGAASSPYDNVSTPFDGGRPDLDFEPEVPLPSDWGMPDLSTPSDTGPSFTDTLRCAGATALAAAACSPVAGGPLDPACYPLAINAVGQCASLGRPLNEYLPSF
jgi:hypothetical protein